MPSPRCEHAYSTFPVRPVRRSRFSDGIAAQMSHVPAPRWPVSAGALDRTPRRCGIAGCNLRPVVALFILLILHAGVWGCREIRPRIPPAPPPNHNPVIDSLVAYPDTIGPSDSTLVVCYARDPDRDSLVYDWETDARLNIQGNPTWNKYLNEQPSPGRILYNANLPNPINDSAWAYCSARDQHGGGAGRHVFIILRR